jgi:hypothetical protein
LLCGARVRLQAIEPALEQAEHGADFAGRATGDVDKGQQLVGRAALEALGDVV